jgi:hypothetical protein
MGRLERGLRARDAGASPTQAALVVATAAMIGAASFSIVATIGWYPKVPTSVSTLLERPDASAQGGGGHGAGRVALAG